VLSSVTGALTRLGFDILTFQAHTWADGTTHLWLRAAHRGESPPEERVAAALTDAVTGRAARTAPATGALHNPRIEAVPVTPRIRVQLGENPFYSVLEVQCRDRPGLVRDLARTFEDLSLTLEYVLVTTHGPAARDVFHLKDIFGGRIEGSDKLKALVDRVSRVTGASGPGQPKTGVGKRSRS
jgi:[protein-PII] uridylyltransferase